MTGWRLQVSPSTLVLGVTRWLTGGILLAGDVNGHADTFIISAGVTWSLQFEWFFYASLFVTAHFARNSTSRFLFPIAAFFGAALVTVLHPTSMKASAAAMFSIGMIAALSKSSGTLRKFSAPQWALSSLIIILICLVLFFSNRIYGIESIILLGLAFLLVIFDGTIFGLLLTRGARRLGDISYGIYLLQGPVLFVVFWPAVIRAGSMSSPWFHWAVVMIAALLLTALSTAAHVVIEKPGVQLGQQLAAKVHRMRRISGANSANQEGI